MASERRQPKQSHRPSHLCRPSCNENTRGRIAAPTLARISWRSSPMDTHTQSDQRQPKPSHRPSHLSAPCYTELPHRRTDAPTHAISIGKIQMKGGRAKRLPSIGNRLASQFPIDGRRLARQLFIIFQMEVACVGASVLLCGSSAWHGADKWLGLCDGFGWR